MEFFKEISLMILFCYRCFGFTNYSKAWILISYDSIEDSPVLRKSVDKLHANSSIPIGFFTQLNPIEK